MSNKKQAPITVEVKDNTFGRALADTCLAAGLPLLSLDKCAQLLAWVYVHGGGNSDVTMQPNLNRDIYYATQRFNFKSGERPDAEGVKLIQQYVRELHCGMGDLEWLRHRSESIKTARPDWLIDIEQRYHTTSGGGV